MKECVYLGHVVGNGTKQSCTEVSNPYRKSHAYQIVKRIFKYLVAVNKEYLYSKPLFV